MPTDTTCEARRRLSQEEVISTHSGEAIAGLAGLPISHIKRTLGFYPIAFRSDLTEQMDQDTVADFYQGDKTE